MAIFAGMRIAMINTTDGVEDAPARIMDSICRRMQAEGHEVMVISGRSAGVVSPHVAMHAALSRIDDSEGMHSQRFTRKLISRLEHWKPDLIHLHNLHGHYLHIPTLIEWIADSGIPVVFTLHDCWLYTGHCTLYTHVVCDLWRRGCDTAECPCRLEYPRTRMSRVHRNLILKWQLMEKVKGHSIIAPVSRWQYDEIKDSILGGHEAVLIENGVDVNFFTPTEAEEYDKTSDNVRLLAVARRWDDPRKGFDDIIRLAGSLRPDMELAIVGRLSRKQRQIMLGNPRIKLLRTLSTEALRNEYRQADVVIVPSRGESFGMTAVEAMACGVPVVANRVEGMATVLANSPGAVLTDTTDVKCLLKGIDEALLLDRAMVREWVVDHYSLERMIEAYLSVYKRLT